MQAFYPAHRLLAQGERPQSGSSGAGRCEASSRASLPGGAEGRLSPWALSVRTFPCRLHAPQHPVTGFRPALREEGCLCMHIVYADLCFPGVAQPPNCDLSGAAHRKRMGALWWEPGWRLSLSQYPAGLFTPPPPSLPLQLSSKRSPGTKDRVSSLT